MKKTISAILLFSVMFSLLLGMDITASEFENKEALQMYMVENTISAINKSKEERKQSQDENSRGIASTSTNDDEFEELINSEDVEPLFDQIDELEKD